MTTIDITKLSYEKINDEYSKAKYGDFNVIMMMSNGYINATKLCADGKKLFKNCIRNEGFKELIEYFNSLAHNRADAFIIKTGGSESILRGTYVHPDLIPHIACWVSPSFAFKVSKIVNEFLLREYQLENIKLSMNLKRKIEELDESKEIVLQKEDIIIRLERTLREMKEMNIKTNLEQKERYEKTMQKLDNTQDTLIETKHILKNTEKICKRTEDKLDDVAELIVPPTVREKHHEIFNLYRINNGYTVTCVQKSGSSAAHNRVLSKHKEAVKVITINPTPNTKNILYRLKETYGSGKNKQIKISYNSIELVGDTTEKDLFNFIDEINEENIKMTKVV